MLMHRPKDLSDSCNLLMSLKSCKHFDSVKQEFLHRDFRSLEVRGSDGAMKTLMWVCLKIGYLKSHSQSILFTKIAMS